jgi:hypothetical protein
MQSAFFNLNGKDLAKGLVVAIAAALFAKLAEVLNVPGFDFVTYDWSTLISVAITAGIGYLTKNLGSTQDGKFVGKIG